jgi:hypothetical protein
MKHNNKPFDQVDFCIRWESGDMGKEEMVAGFQHMIDDGIVWQLQGTYGRTATALIDAGLCHK